MPSSPQTAADRIRYLEDILSRMRPWDTIQEAIRIPVTFSPWDMIRDPRAIMGETFPVEYRTRSFSDLQEELNQLRQAAQPWEGPMPISRPAPIVGIPSPYWWIDEASIMQSMTINEEEPHGTQDHSDPPDIEPDMSMDVVENQPSSPTNERLTIPQTIYASMVEIGQQYDGVRFHEQENQINMNAPRGDFRFIAIIHKDLVEMIHANPHGILGNEEGEHFLGRYHENQITEGGHMILNYIEQDVYFRLDTGNNRLLPCIGAWLVYQDARAVNRMADEAYEPFGCRCALGEWPETAWIPGRNNHNGGGHHKALRSYAKNLLKIVSDDFARRSPAQEAATANISRMHML
jgi:hypothetical protein